MTQRAQQLNATANAQISALIDLIATADPSEVPAASAAGPSVSVFTPVDSIAYTPCRPTEITRRRFSTSSAIAAITNGVMSR